jgi:hypothetical protein
MVMTQQQQVAFDEGAAARRAGIKSWDNPYADGDRALFVAWARGWAAQDALMASKVDGSDPDATSNWS